MFCRFCGTENADDMNFCMKCGKPLKKVAPVQEEKSPATKKPEDKTMLAILIMAVIFLVILGVFFLIVLGMKKDKNSEEATVEQERGVNLGDIQVGEVVTFGEYEQDSNISNGKEPMQWDVIACEDGRYLLLSHYVIDYMAYDDGRADDTLAANEEVSASYCTWADSTLRMWCNNTFYNESFSEAEKGYICEVTNNTGDWIDINDGKLGHSDVGYEAGKGCVTQDKVFLLSVEEIRKYFAGDIQDRGIDSLNPSHIYIPRLLASPTYYAMDQGCYTDGISDIFTGVNLDENGYDQTYGEESLWNMYYYGNVHKDYTDFGYLTTYGFRSPGGYIDNSSFVMIQTWGNLNTFDAEKSTDKLGVRPAIWIQSR